MEDISKSFGDKRAERKEYRVAKRDAFEKARDRGEFKFDATTPLDSSFTSLTAATAANIFAKNREKKKFRKSFEESYLAGKNKEATSTKPTSNSTGTTSAGATVRGSDSSEASYNKELLEINSRNAPKPASKTDSTTASTTAKPTSKSDVGKTKSKGMASAFSPERIAQYKKKGWAMDNTTHRNASSKSSGTSTGEKNIQNRIEKLKETGEIKPKPANSSNKPANSSNKPANSSRGTNNWFKEKMEGALEKINSGGISSAFNTDYSNYNREGSVYTLNKKNNKKNG